MKIIVTLFLVFLNLNSIYTQNIKTQSQIIIEIKNPISINRDNETIAVTAMQIKKAFPNIALDLIQIKDLENNTILNSQAIDYNQDGIYDELLFQTNIKANEKKQFQLNFLKKRVKSTSKVYASYMSSEEGMEDFSWENNFIGYRFYGQERSVKQGTGIAMDIWCKRTSDLINNKWYTPNQNYHIDKGYGADHYSSGKNQGCGGSGIYKKDSIHFSNAFNNWKIIAKGPIRVVFELEFSGWSFNQNIIETKRVTFDANNYFNKIESTYNSEIDFKNFNHAVGIVQRNNSETKIEQNLGYVASWEPLGETKGNLGTGFISTRKNLEKVKTINNHIVSLLKPNSKNTTQYYTGAAWDEFGKIKTFEIWEIYVKNKAKCINNPCIVSIQ